MSVVVGRQKKNTQIPLIKQQRTFLISDYYLYNYKKWKIVPITIVSINSS